MTKTLFPSFSRTKYLFVAAIQCEGAFSSSTFSKSSVQGSGGITRIRAVAFNSPNCAVTVPACGPALLLGVNWLFSSVPVKPVRPHSIEPIALVCFPFASKPMTLSAIDSPDVIVSAGVSRSATAGSVLIVGASISLVAHPIAKR